MPSHVVFHGKMVNVRDYELTFLLHMLLQSLTRFGDDEWSRRARLAWESRLVSSGFGCYELDLEELVTSQQEKQRMLEVFADTREQIRGHGPYLKREWMNSLPGVDVVYTEDPETSWYLERLAEIEGLLKSSEL